MRSLVVVACGLFVVVSGCECRGARLAQTADAGCYPEVCDGLDNDCNGVVDDGLGEQSCGVGACARTMPTCVNGGVATCLPGTPTAEVCDGLDNDCNGQVDDGVAAVTCGVGECTVTVAACADGGVATCTPKAPTAELCDGLDNDCNGQVDDGLVPLTCGVGACARSVMACVSAAEQSCVPGQPSVEVCDGEDNDCNGQVDDGVCLAPVTMCDATTVGRVGVTQTLASTATDLDGTVISTVWTVVSRPAGSIAQPTTPTTLSTDFTPDVAGTFTLQFCATNDRSQVTCCTVNLTTTACTSPPSPPVSTACGTSWDGRPIVQFDPVPTGLTYELTQADGGTVLASATEAQNWLRPAARVAAGGPPPGTATDLEVRACRANDPTCCSTPSPLTVNVVESCTTPTTPTASNLVLSEYVTDGEGACPSVDCATQDTCQAGESVEITNLSNCPVALDGFHFAYRNATANTASLRWMNFGTGDVIPPRGVYVAMRSMQFAPTCSAGLPAESPGLYGLKISALSMQGQGLCSGWFNNSGGGLSELQVAPGTVPDAASLTFTPAAALARVAPYLASTGTGTCPSVGFDAVDSCGTVVGGTAPTASLSPNQLGRLWHPCDAVLAPVPVCVRN